MFEELFNKANPFKRNVINYVGFDLIATALERSSLTTTGEMRIISEFKLTKKCQKCQRNPMHLVCFICLILNLWKNLLSLHDAENSARFSLREPKSFFTEIFSFFALFTSSMGRFFGFSTLTTTHTLTERDERKIFLLRLLLRLFSLLFFSQIYWWNYFYLFIDFFPSLCFQ